MAAQKPFTVTWFAMGTQWQLTIIADRPESHLAAVAEAIVADVEQTEQLLSFYRDTSELSELNVVAAMGPYRADPRLFRLLERAQSLSGATSGAFDPTVGPLLRCWGFVGNTGAMPAAREIESARSVVGMAHVHLDAATQTVWLDRPGVEIEFGAIGKGYAIERAVELLRDEYEIESALIHGGTSTIYALGAPPGGSAWNVAIQRPFADAGESVVTLPLRDRAVSVSAPHGKWFEHDGRRFGHVLDPRTGAPVAGSVLSVVATASATESDALSTALLVLGEPGIATIRALRPDAFVLVGTHEERGGLNLVQDGPTAG
jgi:FAD:protein FMN transferase